MNTKVFFDIFLDSGLWLKVLEMNVVEKYGFNPRIYPRPRYPSGFAIFVRTAVEMLIQSGLVGLILVVTLYPYFIQTVNHLRVFFLGFGDHSDRIIFTLLASIVHTSIYVFVNGFFHLFDTLKIFQNYKLLRTSRMQPKKSLLRNTLFKAFFGQFIVNPLITFFLYPYSSLKEMVAPLPSYSIIFFTFCFAYLFNGITFYWTHRMLHSKLLYARFHKDHHEWQGTEGISAEHAHPVEALFSNIIPTLGGVLILGTHPLIFGTWLGIRLQQTYEVHSGYCFKGTFLDAVGLTHASGAAHHDYHHVYNEGNFGTGEYMDWIFGTMDGYAANGYLEGYIGKKEKL